MKFSLQATIAFSSDITVLKDKIQPFLESLPSQIFPSSNAQEVTIAVSNICKNSIETTIISTGSKRPHNMLLQIKNAITREFGKKYQLGIRKITITQYDIIFSLEKPPLKQVSIPFADLHIQDTLATLSMKEISEEFLKKNYIDRLIRRVKEKIEDQYYKGKTTYWKLIWESTQKKQCFTKDPTEEMIRLKWIKQGPTKGKWFYRPQATAILNTMETIALKEVLEPLGFQEVIGSHIIPFDIWIKTGHFEGMPAEFYYICEPKTRDQKQWERLIDLTKITKTIPTQELHENISSPTAGICYAQCPMIYWSLKGMTIEESSLPILIYDRTAISCRYESGGRHGIERVDEFHRIEPVYIGTQEQLLILRKKMLDRYKKVFNEIFELEWRMAWVTPWYMQQAGQHRKTIKQDTGTIDFEAYMPYRGSRKNTEWLEFQNLSILGDKYINAFNIKAQKSQLWSGCSGIGLQRWATAFLAQNGLDSTQWPKKFRTYLSELPKGIQFV